MGGRIDFPSRPHGLEARVTDGVVVTRASSPCVRVDNWTARVLFGFSLLHVLSTTGHAQQVELSSPLDGYVRPGRAAAIHVRAAGVAGDALTIDGEGVVPVRIPTSAGRVDATVPLLSVGDPPAELKWSDGRTAGTVAFAARPLAAADRLIVVGGDAPDAADVARALFPGHRPVVVRLDASAARPLHPPQAFDAADAVLLDLSAAARVGESQLATLLAAGTAVAVRSPARPQGAWPWQRLGAWWVLRHEVAGPAGGVSTDAYAPTFAWDRSRPAGLRRAALLTAVLVAMLLVGATLWRSRWAVAACLGVCASAGGAAVAFGRSLAPTVTAAGEVVVSGGGLAQRDRWTYVSALRDGRASVAASDVTRPMLGTRRQLQGMGLTLACEADGTPAAFEFNLAGRQTIAFVSRSVEPAEGVEARAPADVPIGLIADRLYPGTVAGQVPGVPADAPGEWWGTVVMRR